MWPMGETAGGADGMSTVSSVKLFCLFATSFLIHGFMSGTIQRVGIVDQAAGAVAVASVPQHLAPRSAGHRRDETGDHELEPHMTA